MSGRDAERKRKREREREREIEREREKEREKIDKYCGGIRLFYKFNSDNKFVRVVN